MARRRRVHSSPDGERGTFAGVHSSPDGELEFQEDMIDSNTALLPEPVGRGTNDPPSPDRRCSSSLATVESIGPVFPKERGQRHNGENRKNMFV